MGYITSISSVEHYIIRQLRSRDYSYNQDSIIFNHCIREVVLGLHTKKGTGSLCRTDSVGSGVHIVRVKTPGQSDSSI